MAIRLIAAEPEKSKCIFEIGFSFPTMLERNVSHKCTMSKILSYMLCTFNLVALNEKHYGSLKFG